MRPRIPLSVCALALLWACHARADEFSSLDPTQQKILLSIATAHLDTQWNWTIQDTIRTSLPATLDGNFALFAKYPDYIFNFEGAFRYALIKEYYPESYATLASYVNQGRWSVAGSSWDSGDVNVPSPESLFRHFLYGNGFFQQEFKRTSRDVFLPDCFGFGLALPSVAAHAGLKGFSTQKLAWGAAIPIPFDLGLWEGPDGATIIAALNGGDYTSTIGEDLSKSQSFLTVVNDQGAATGLFLGYRYYGVGDKGGAPTEGSVSWLETSLSGTGPLKVLTTPSDTLFKELKPAHEALLHKYHGELLLSTHGTGCYTAHGALKRWNRQNELLGDGAERAAVVADWLAGAGYPRQTLTDAWRRFLWHQFHDDLTGTAIPEAYPFSWNDEILSLNQFSTTLTDAAGSVASALDTSAQGVPLVVYNPLSSEREDIVDSYVTFPHGAPSAVRVYDPQGNEVPSQASPVSPQVLRVLFAAKVPSVGFAVFDVRASSEPCTLSTGLTATAQGIENEHYRVVVDSSGHITSVRDKTQDRELVRPGDFWGLALFDHWSFVWPAWEITHATVSQKPRGYADGSPTLKVVESGPARVALQIETKKDGSTFVQTVRLGALGAGDRVEFDTSIDWNTQATLLKASFPLSVSSPKATYDLGLGTIQRGNNTEKLYEVPAQQWAGLSSSDGQYGVAIFSDSKYGWDKPTDSQLRLTLLHTPGVAVVYTHQKDLDIGPHHFVIGVSGHSGSWAEAAVPWKAARLNQPLQAFQTIPHSGTLGRSFSFLSSDNPNVIVRAVKKAEQSDELIVRLQELSGDLTQTATLTFAAPIVSARETTATEEAIGPLTPSGNALTLALSTYQPKTIALSLQPQAAPVAAPQSQPLTLAYDLDGLSHDANKTDGDLDGKGNTIPAELWPSTLVRDGVSFQLGPASDGSLNVLSCKGQKLSLGSEGFDQLYLLVATVGPDTSADFLVDGIAHTVQIPNYADPVGLWKPAVLKRTPVAWNATHRHRSDGTNDPYQFFYLFKQRIDLPRGAKELTLPTDSNLRLFAVSLARGAYDAQTAPAGGLVQDYVQIEAAAPRLQVVAPNGGETWIANSAVEVTWVTQGLVGPVDIDLSTDDGAEWSNLLYATDNDGVESLFAPALPSTHCRIRVREHNLGDPSDTSDESFSIVAGAADAGQAEAGSDAVASDAIQDKALAEGKDALEAGSSPTASDAPGEDGGCSCQVPGAADSRSWGLAAWLAMLLMRRWRRGARAITHSEIATRASYATLR